MHGDSNTTIYLYPTTISDVHEEVLGNYDRSLEGSLILADSESGKAAVMPNNETNVCLGVDDGTSLLTEYYSMENGASYDEDIRFLIH